MKLPASSASDKVDFAANKAPALTPAGLVRAALGVATTGLLAVAAWSGQNGSAQAVRLGCAGPLNVAPQQPSYPQQVLQRPVGQATRRLPEVAPAGETFADLLPEHGRALQAVATERPEAPRKAYVLYSGWHYRNWRETASRQAAGEAVHTIEEVFASEGKLGFSKITESKDGGWSWNTQPRRGFYSIYTPRRPGDLHFNPDFDDKPGDPNYRRVLRQHARLLTPFDGVVLDATNLSGYDEQADELQLRPFENLVHVWSQLRKGGVPTPNVSVWLRLPAPGSSSDGDYLFPKFLDVMNLPAYRHMFERDRTGDKMVVYYSALAPAGKGFIRELKANGGRHNIAAIPMGAHLDSSKPATPQTLSFLSACASGAAVSDDPCGQVVTSNAHLGTMMSAAASYQLSYAGIPGGATGIQRGIVLRRQFAEVFAQSPDNLFVASFNEMQAQRVSIAPGTSPIDFSMGYPYAARAQNHTYVDLYGKEYSRDFEPTVDGKSAYNLMAACVTRYTSGATHCEDAADPCCLPTEASDLYATVNAGTERSFVLAAPQRKLNKKQAALYACDADGNHFSLNADCGGRAAGQHVGNLSKVKVGSSLRGLLLCSDGQVGGMSISLVGACPANTRQQKLLGYVR